MGCNMQWPQQNDMRTFYGNPDTDKDGLPDAKWEREHLTKVAPPFRMVLAWNIGQPISTMRVHKKCALSLLYILQKIHGIYGGDQAKIEEARMHLYGGAYNFRLTRGGTRLSTHAFGAAIDLDPANNPLGKPWEPDTGMIDLRVVEIFEAAGWVWGGRWHRPDCQHFQAAII
jgi:hypothetical protein